MESLSDKLKSLGMQPGVEHISPKQKRETHPIESVVSGELVSAGGGQVFIHEDHMPVDYRHGIVAMDYHPVDVSVIFDWANLQNPPIEDLSQIAFLDTETSGLAGGTGTFPFMIGVGRHTPGGYEVRQFFMRDPYDETAQLVAFMEWMEQFKLLVTFNGKSFDVPILNTRFVLHRLPSPLINFPHLDMLPLARRLWKNRLPSRALKDLEIDILNLRRSEEEVPGWLVPQLYFEYLQSQDARPLAGVFYHNSLDIISLAAVFHHAAGLLQNPLDCQTIEALDLAAIARLYEDLRQFTDAAKIYEASLAQGLPRQFFLQTLEKYALLCRRQENWTAAVELWQKSAEHGQISACVALAKFYEHQHRNYEIALRWVNTASQLLSTQPGAQTEILIWQPDLENRRARLQRKLGSTHES